MKALAFWTMLLAISTSAHAKSPSSAAHCPQFTSSSLSQAFDRRAEAGDRRAAYCLALGLHSLDGGELEDALVALGQYGDLRPVELLDMARRGALSRRSLADAVTMLPLSLTDDMPAQLTAMKARRDRFRKVAKPELASERHLALKSIDSALAEIQAYVSTR